MTTPIIDSHVHLWNPARFPMPWVEGDAVLEQPYEVETFAAQTAEHGVTGLVYVETAVDPTFALLEAQWIAELAQTNPLIKGIVVHAPLEYGIRTRRYLDALATLGPRIKGVRRNLQSENDPEFCLQKSFLESVRALPEYSFSFDICVTHAQLPAVTEMVRRCPETTFILDHLGKPNANARQLEPWRTNLRALAALPNVACKLSGLVTEADHANWTPEGLAPYVMHVLGCFGKRTMFGSDWPVMKLAADYGRWLQTVQGLTEGLSPEETTQLCSGAAQTWYRLEP